jgi:hypothetical protein
MNLSIISSGQTPSDGYASLGSRAIRLGRKQAVVGLEEAVTSSPSLCEPASERNAATTWKVTHIQACLKAKKATWSTTKRSREDGRLQLLQTTLQRDFAQRDRNWITGRR